MNLTFQVLCNTVLYSNRLSPPDASTTEHGFLFGFFTSFFLELLAIALCSSPVVYWTPSDLARGLIFWWHIFLLFHTIHGVLEGRILKWVAISSSSGLCFVRTLHYDLSIWWGGAYVAWLIASLSYRSPFAQQGCYPGRGLCTLFLLLLHELHLRLVSSVQSLSCVQLFVTPWTAARQASLSITTSWSLLKLMSIESVMPPQIIRH